MALSLTKRQRVLLDRLLTFGNWLTEGKLPVEIMAVYGFGSFFRGKAKPADMDLVIRCSGDTADFRLFSELLRKATFDRGADRFLTPCDALLSAFDQHCVRFEPAIADSTALRQLFAQWIGGYSWAKIYAVLSRYGSLLLGSREIVKRLLRRCLPGLNTPVWLGPKEPVEQSGLYAGFTVLVWSRERPDIQANVEAVLAQDSRHVSILAELANLDPLLFRLETLSNAIKEAIERLLRTPRSRTRSQSAKEWFWLWAKRHFGPDTTLLQRAMTVAAMRRTFGNAALERSVSAEFIPRSYEGVSLEQLSQFVEEKRSRTKALGRYLTVSPGIIWALAEYKSNCVSTELSPREYLLERLRSTHNRQQWRMLVPILAELGIAVAPSRRV